MLFIRCRGETTVLEICLKTTLAGLALRIIRSEHYLLFACQIWSNRYMQSQPSRGHVIASGQIVNVILLAASLVLYRACTL